MSLREEVSKMATQIEKVYCLLTGDCNDGIKLEDGMVYKVQQHENFIQFWTKFGWAIIVSSFTIPPAVVTVVVLHAIHLKPI